MLNVAYEYQARCINCNKLLLYSRTPIHMMPQSESAKSGSVMLSIKCERCELAQAIEVFNGLDINTETADIS